MLPAGKSIQFVTAKLTTYIFLAQIRHFTFAASAPVWETFGSNYTLFQIVIIKNLSQTFYLPRISKNLYLKLLGTNEDKYELKTLYYLIS